MLWPKPTLLASLAVRGGCLAPRAEFLQLKAVRGVTTVLLRDVVAFLAFGAGKGDLRTHISRFASHSISLQVFPPALPTGRPRKSYPAAGPDPYHRRGSHTQGHRRGMVTLLIASPAVEDRLARGGSYFVARGRLELPTLRVATICSVFPGRGLFSGVIARITRLCSTRRIPPMPRVSRMFLDVF